ncbi:hypothetical protein K1719_026133 [Acacia pycnantha]|nr:hypothetical protein K1719_026133 [Acacia pycnantha]
MNRWKRFFKFVLEKSVSDDPLKPSSQRWGVIQCVDAKEHTVKVQWKTVTISKQENLAENKMETVSAYELVEHPDFCYCLGDIVFKMVQIQLDDQAYKDCGKSVVNSNVEAALRDRPSNIYQKELHDNFYLSCIGNVVGFVDGSLEVKWANGLLTKVAPYEIVRVDRIEGSRTSFVPEANSEEFTQEINDHGSLSSDHKETGLSNVNGSEKCDKHPKDCSSSSLSQAAFRLLSSIKASLFHTIGVASHSSAISYDPTSVEGNEPGFQYQEKVSETCALCKELHPMRKLQSTENRTPDQEVIRDNKDFSFSLDSHEPDQFKQFDILCNCSDHHFFEERKDLALSQAKRSWMKKVQQEWSILEKNLPDTIFVCVFEQRMDLLRAAIVGAPGTPYHDGLFFFDICFPPEYPNEPPMVHYISGGLRLNPNLYESGQVCLSILNTWTGTGTEVWNPGASTVLQVLLSVQALVLNEKPYFNEAGYDQQIGRAEGERNSVSYNENAFLVTCKSMLYILKRPPKHFEALVEEHFSQRSQSILQSCRAYLEGAPLAFPFGCPKTVQEAMNGTSKGFKIMLNKLFPKLVEAFSDKGIDCSQFVQLQNNCFKLQDSAASLLNLRERYNEETTTRHVDYKSEEEGFQERANVNSNTFVNEDVTAMPTTPPKNALLLTRCRSVPYRSSSLAFRFWGSSLNCEETEEALKTELQNEKASCQMESVSDTQDRLDPRAEEEPEFFKELGDSIKERIIKSENARDLKREDGGGDSAGPLILTRCKSEPARTAQKLDPEFNFWKKRRLGLAGSCSPHYL